MIRFISTCTFIFLLASIFVSCNDSGSDSNPSGEDGDLDSNADVATVSHRCAGTLHQGPLCESSDDCTDESRCGQLEEEWTYQCEEDGVCVADRLSDDGSDGDEDEDVAEVEPDEDDTITEQEQ